jgi:hypothetical protein
VVEHAASEFRPAVDSDAVRRAASPRLPGLLPLSRMHVLKVLVDSSSLAAVAGKMTATDLGEK